ncbi:MAG: hypothetical protein QOD99_1281 [Chthoniobacter sp.]|jgi:hypothetical protein|nr:hypothetical protein [Chthoniobacter sp.]
MSSLLAWLKGKALVLSLAVTALIALAAVWFARNDAALPKPTAISKPAAKALAQPESSRGAAKPGTSPDSSGTERDDLKRIVAGIIDSGTAADIRGWTETLLKGDAEQRADAIRELGFLDDPRWLPVVVWVLGHDAEASVRSTAAGELATQSGSPAAAHALAEALTDSELDVRENALLSLKALRNDTVEKDLRRLLAEGHLDAATTDEVRLLLVRYYVTKDPLADPLGQ